VTVSLRRLCLYDSPLRSSTSPPRSLHDALRISPRDKSSSLIRLFLGSNTEPAAPSSGTGEGRVAVAVITVLSATRKGGPCGRAEPGGGRGRSGDREQPDGRGWVVGWLGRRLQRAGSAWPPNRPPVVRASPGDGPGRSRRRRERAGPPGR